MTTVRRVPLHGYEVAVRIAGNGPIVVLVHGMAGASATWQRVMPTLAREYTVVAPDLLGHGDSDKPQTEYSISGHANVLHDLLSVMGVERATLVGQSYGGGVVMQLAYQYPEVCERLVLVSSGGLGREVSGLLRALSLPGADAVLPLVCSPALRDASAAVAEWLGRHGVRAAPAVEEVWRSWASLADPPTRAAFFQTLRAVIGPDGQTVSARERLYLAAHVPTLIVWGADDRLIPVAHAHDTHAHIPGSRLVVLDDVGHFPHVEAPEAFLTHLGDFLGSTTPACVSGRDRGALLRAGAAPPSSWLGAEER